MDERSPYNLPMRQLCSRPAPGFILVATLFVITLIAIGAGYFASRVDSLRTSAQQTQSLADAEREAFSTRQALMHAAITNRLGVRGLEVPNAPMAIDGRAYRINDNFLLRVQDERGLISLNASGEGIMRRFLTVAGVPVERHNRLLDALADYIDIDDLKRLDGAESKEYSALGLPPPANDFLVSRDELWRVAAWGEMLGELELHGGPGLATRFVNNFSASRWGGINVNSAPYIVLLSIPGVDPGRVSSLLDQRRNLPFVNLAQLGMYSNGPLDDESVMLVGANSWRVSHERGDLPFLLECRLVLSPVAFDRPVQLNECRHRARADTSDDVTPAEIGGALGAIRNDETRIQQASSRPSNNKEIRQRASLIEAPRLPWLAESLEFSRR
jgi:general secretion pathway protein K